MSIAAHPLTLHLAASGEGARAFAHRAGVAPSVLGAVLAGHVTPDLSLARRLAAASGGAVKIGDLLVDAPVADTLLARAPTLNAPLLTAVIEVVAPDVFPPQSPEAYRAAEAATDIYAALGPVTALSRADRLAAALRPALKQSFAGRAGRDVTHAARRAARLYFAAEARLSA